MPTTHLRPIATAAVVGVLAAGAMTAASHADQPGSGPLVFDAQGAMTPTFSPMVPQAFDIAGAGGTPIHVIVYRPDTTGHRGWKSPVIVDDSPYYNSPWYDEQATAEGHSSPDQGQLLVDHFVPRGYTVVKMEERGSALSGGCYDDNGPQSAVDFKNVVEYFAAQPWTNHKVGSWGGSADGTSQINGAVTQPRGLVTIVPIAAITSVYDGRAFGGVPFDGFWGNGTDYYFTPMLFGANDPSQSAADGVAKRLDRACGYPNWVQGMQYIQDGTEDAFYRARDHKGQAMDIKASVLYVAGMKDDVVRPNATDGWYDNIQTFKRAIFAEIPHEPVFDADPSVARADWWNIFDAWLDYWLLGRNTGVTDWPPVQVQSEDNSWHAVGSFAGLGTPTSYPLGQGTLDTPGTSESTGATASYVEPQEVTWTSAPLTAPLHLAGDATVHLHATIDKTNARFMVALREITPSGTRQLTSGYLDADHNDSLTNPQLITPNVPVDYTIHLYPFDTTSPAGAQLELVISGIDITDQSATTGGRFIGTGIPAGNGYTTTIAVDGNSSLELSVANDSCGLVVPVPDGQQAPAADDCPQPPRG